MPETRIDSAVASDLTNVMTDFSVASETTDAAGDQKETIWMDSDWNDYFGYYTDDKIPEITAVIDAQAEWTVGKGFKADEETTMLLDSIKGFGYDTFNTILENAARTMLIGGNFYAQKIRDKEGNLINLKVLSPETMRHHANRKGIITHFEQVSRTKGANPTVFSKDEIFYLHDVS